MYPKLYNDLKAVKMDTLDFRGIHHSLSPYQSYQINISIGQESVAQNVYSSYKFRNKKFTAKVIRNDVTPLQCFFV